MPTLTLAEMTALVKVQIAANKIAQDAPFVPTVDAITGLVDKIGKQFTLDSVFTDRLPELDGEELPFGTTIEEYFFNMMLPAPTDDNGANNMAPNRPTKQEVSYSYKTPRYTHVQTVETTKLKSGLLGESEFASLTASIMKKLYDAKTIHKYAIKRQALGRFISAITKADMIRPLAIPVDTETGEAWVKDVKLAKEAMELINEKYNMRGVPAVAESLVLYIKSGIQPVIDVNVLAGSFNSDRVDVPVTVKVLEDFGDLTANQSAYAILMDTRAVRVHPYQTETDQDHNGKGGFTNIYLKEGYTTHYSKVVSAVIWTVPTPAGS